MWVPYYTYACGDWKHLKMDPYRISVGNRRKRISVDGALVLIRRRSPRDFGSLQRSHNISFDPLLEKKAFLKWNAIFVLSLFAVVLEFLFNSQLTS